MKHITQNKLGLIDTIKSTLMSFLGVQKESVRERDFQHGRPLYFILTGIVLTILFVFLLIGVVKLILNSAGI